MKKNLLAIVCVFASMLSLSAAAGTDEYRYLTLTLNDSCEASYLLEGFRVTYDAQNMYIESNGGKYTVATEKLVKMNFTETETSIAGTKLRAAVEINADGSVTVSPAQNAVVKVYSTDGTLVMQQKAEAGKATSFSLDVPKGIYIMNINGQSVKFEKK